MSGKKSASDNPKLTVLYDGWALTYAPGSPAAMHLLALLAVLPDEIDRLVAVPAPTPHTLPPRSDIQRHAAENTPSAHLNWEQRVLPMLAEKSSASLLHLTGPNAPLASPVPVIISPVEVQPAHAAPPRGLADRLRRALVFGAAGGVQAVLWPQDLPLPPANASLTSLPPLAHPAFWGPPAWDSRLPDAYILAAGPLHPPALELLVEGWKWAGPAVGGNFPLVLPGLSADQKRQWEQFTAGWDLDETLRFLPADTLPDRAALLGQAAAVVCLDEPAPWGDPLLEALAAGKPITAPETDLISARVGPAAYLFPPRDARALGAALTTLVVEEEVAENLSRSARQRAEGWDSAQFGQKLAETYRRIVRT